ncbi:MAG: tRNA (N6-isopentenyl adenosine(37)-C2)-methylthiotransferase MiaB [Candidatus Omnitrophica bacterium]|nr:tRNA (N6-isopentenyl adenosine(37)-C2)-methylthiotransferase MiaB [Candidatus Omnitrophota bacterium]
MEGKTPVRKIYIKTYGCQMNFYDSEKIKALMVKKGYGIADSPGEADFIAVNACSVRKHAEDRAMAFLSSHMPLRKKGARLCLLGCTANLYGEDILKKHPFIDIVCGAGNYERLPEMLGNTKRKTCSAGESENPFIEDPVIACGDISAFVTVTKGCENYCSYCVVPFTRGKLASRKPSDIYAEVRSLAGRGVKEIVLLGQNVNEYGKDSEARFTDLLEKIHNIEGILRIWFLTSHPKDIPDELLLSFKNLPKLYRHLHLPLQSGSDRLLLLMNRRYTLARYLEIIKRAREIAPDITITSDIITGFPSETEKDFEDTVSAVKKIEFDDLFIFKYSERPGTAASGMQNDVPQKEKERRHKVLLDIQEDISLKRNTLFNGRTENVFVVKPSTKKNGCFMGRSEGNKSVIFRASHSAPGTLESVVFNYADRRYLFGASCGGNDK